MGEFNQQMGILMATCEQKLFTATDITISVPVAEGDIPANLDELTITLTNVNNPLTSFTYNKVGAPIAVTLLLDVAQLAIPKEDILLPGFWLVEVTAVETTTLRNLRFSPCTPQLFFHA